MTPEEQAAVDSYLAGGGDQASVDAYFAGNPSQDQFMSDASQFFDVGNNTPAGRDLLTAPKRNAWDAQNPEYYAANTPATIAQHRIDDAKYGPGSGTIYDPWLQTRYVDKDGNPLPGYGYGASTADQTITLPNGQTVTIPGQKGPIVKLSPGGNPNAPGAGQLPTGAPSTGQGTPSIFDFFNDLFKQFQAPQQQQPQQQQQQMRYAPGFQPGGANDPMIIQNAIANQSDPNSMAGLFNKMADSFNTLQQGQGGAQPIMSGMGYGGYSDGGNSSPQYQSQYVAPAPAPAPTTPAAPAAPAWGSKYFNKPVQNQDSGEKYF
jgi:hypothetical protein